MPHAHLSGVASERLAKAVSGMPHAEGGEEVGSRVSHISTGAEADGGAAYPDVRRTF